jgi:hypothetical protein
VTSTGATISTRVAAGSAAISRSALSGSSRSTRPPQVGHEHSPTCVYSRRRWSLISVIVPTVERALRMVFFCASATAGGMLLMKSTSGRSMRSRNMRV